MGRATASIVLPRPLGPWGDFNIGQISLHFNNKINFKGFYTKLFVFLKIGNILNGIFVLMRSLCSRGGNWGARGAHGDTFFSNMIMWHIKLTGITGMCRTEFK